MVKYECPNGCESLVIGLEITMGGEPEHKCSKCGSIMRVVNEQ